MNTYVVAIIPLAVFTLTGIMGKEELKQINWDVLWLVAGGIAIGIGLEQTGLAQALAHAIDYQSLTDADCDCSFVGVLADDQLYVEHRHRQLDRADCRCDW